MKHAIALRDARTSIGVSQSYVAERVGVSLSLYQKWESLTPAWQKVPSLAELRRVQQVLQLGPDAELKLYQSMDSEEGLSVSAAIRSLQPLSEEQELEAWRSAAGASIQQAA